MAARGQRGPCPLLLVASGGLRTWLRVAGEVRGWPDLRPGVARVAGDSSRLGCTPACGQGLEQRWRPPMRGPGSWLARALPVPIAADGGWPGSLADDTWKRAWVGRSL